MLNIDTNNDGAISYNEFIAASIEMDNVVTKVKIETMFRSFDLDLGGYITRENIKEAYSKFGLKSLSD